MQLHTSAVNVCKSQHPREMNTDNVTQSMEIEMISNTAYGAQQLPEDTTDGTSIYGVVHQ